MMRVLKTLCFALLGCAVVLSGQQTKPLTDREVVNAILKGFDKVHPIGLPLHDELGGCNTCPTQGFSVHLYTAAQWIENGAMQAHRKRDTYTFSGVTPEMRAPVLYVDAWPDLPNMLTAEGMGSASNVQKVVLTDEAQILQVEPLGSKAVDVELASAFRDASYQRVEATFSLEDVAKVRAMSPKGEFFVIVVGDRKNKAFKVKEKMLSKLF